MRGSGVVFVFGIGIVVACGGSNDSNAGGGGSSSSSGGASSSSGSSGASSSGGSSGGASSTSSSGGGTPGPGTMHAGCRIFPNDNPWNTDISGLPVDTDLMTTVMPNMAQDTAMHPDWGTETDNYGIPITTGAAAATPGVLTFHTSYGDGQSDKLPCNQGEWCYPIPLTAKIEGGTGASPGSDRHILFLATDGAPDHCVLYELFNAQNPSGGFECSSAAIWHLDTNALRTEGWTSADAAGLPIMPGLVRYEEVKAGEIKHAIRFTMSRSQNGYIHPATHAAGDNDSSLPPMGLRVRLKASFDDSAFTAASKTIATAMKKYGLILADAGNLTFTAKSDRFDEHSWDEVGFGPHDLKGIPWSDFEVVKHGAVTTTAD